MRLLFRQYVSFFWGFFGAFLGLFWGKKRGCIVCLDNTSPFFRGFFGVKNRDKYAV